MTTAVDEIRSLYKKNEKEALQDFFTFLRFASISTDPEYAPQVQACADWVMKYLQNLGFSVELWPTSGHPVIFASHEKAGNDKPTLLIYHHYDVQPIDPIEEWKSPPFEPEIRNGQVFARGAQDNKGQCFSTLQALKILLQRDGSLPINIKLCIEGEEESGSKGIAGILKQKKSKLKADYLVIGDLGMQAEGSPAITLGVRGLVALEVTAQGSSTDLHSGSHGGLAFNPIHALVDILAKLRDPSGRITVPGFYDDVSEMNAQNKSKITFSFDADKYKKAFGAIPEGGERSFQPLERVWLRPTLEINGIWGGYTGAGFKTVIPAKAHAKISCRLVPNQDKDKIGQLVANHIKQLAPKGIAINVSIKEGGGNAVRAEASSIIAQAFAQSYQDVFQKPCAYILEGGSIPIVPALTDTSEAEVVLVGVGLNEDNVHAPNEHFGVNRLEQATLAMAQAIEKLNK